MNYIQSLLEKAHVAPLKQPSAEEGLRLHKREIPCEIWSRVFSFLESKHYPVLALTCRHWAWVMKPRLDDFKLDILNALNALYSQIHVVRKRGLENSVKGPFAVEEVACQDIRELKKYDPSQQVKIATLLTLARIPLAFTPLGNTPLLKEVQGLLLNKGSRSMQLLSGVHTVLRKDDGLYFIDMDEGHLLGARFLFSQFHIPRNLFYTKCDNFSERLTEMAKTDMDKVLLSLGVLSCPEQVDQIAKKIRFSDPENGLIMFIKDGVKNKAEEDLGRVGKVSKLIRLLCARNLVFFQSGIVDGYLAILAKQVMEDIVLALLFVHEEMLTDEGWVHFAEAIQNVGHRVSICMHLETVHKERLQTAIARLQSCANVNLKIRIPGMKIYIRPLV